MTEFSKLDILNEKDKIDAIDFARVLALENGISEKQAMKFVLEWLEIKYTDMEKNE